MPRITEIINNEQGSMIVVAVIILVLLTVIGISATNTSTTEVQISTNAVLHNIAFYTADSGIEAGRAALNNIKIADAGSWDKLLFNQENQSLLRVDKKKVTWKGSDCIDLNEIMDAEKTYSEVILGVPHMGRTVGPATYTLTVWDNSDLDDNDEVDSDDTVFLESTLVSPYRNATAKISTSVRGGGEAYAQEHYNASSSGEAGAESETASANVRW